MDHIHDIPDESHHVQQPPPSMTNHTTHNRQNSMN